MAAVLIPTQSRVSGDVSLLSSWAALTDAEAIGLTSQAAVLGVAGFSQT